MDIWVVNEAEPLPINESTGRLMRGGVIANTYHKFGHNVTWWFSTFSHYEKKFLFNEYKEIKLEDNFLLKLLHVKKAYKRNISFARINYAYKLSKEFKKKIQSEQKPDAIYCSWPLINECYEATVYAKENNIPIIIDIRDVWPDIFTQPFPSFVKPFVQLILDLFITRRVKYVMENATCVIGVIPDTLKFAQKYGRKLISTDEVYHLSYEKDEFSEEIKHKAIQFCEEKLIKKSNFNLVYIGTITNRIDNLQPLIEMAKAVEKDVPEFNLIICGGGAYLDTVLEQSKSLKNVIVTGYINKPELQEIMERSTLGVIAYRNTTDFVNALPSKFSEYACFSLPILTSLRGLSKQMVEENKAGWYYSDTEDLIELIKILSKHIELIKQYSKASYELYNQYFSVDTVYGKLVKQTETFAKNNKNYRGEQIAK